MINKRGETAVMWGWGAGARIATLYFYFVDVLTIILIK